MKHDEECERGLSWDCSVCGSSVDVDEDGCCVACGTVCSESLCRCEVRALELRLFAAEGEVGPAVERMRAAEALIAEWRPVVKEATEWRSLRMEYEALSAAVQQRFSDAGRPGGYSAWTEDEKLRHTNLLLQVLSKLNALEAAIDAAPAAREAAK